MQKMIKARPRQKHIPGKMNKTEQRYYDEVLMERWRRGEIDEPHFEAVKLQLAKRTHYTPDFYVVDRLNDEIQLHEVKGYWEDDARVKIKVAAATYPALRFIAVRLVKGEWQTEEF